MDPAAPPPVNVVGDETPCSRCGYSLRGLPIVGQCPECGWPVQRSLAGNLLRYADPTYLDTLQRGIVLVLLAVAGKVVLTFVLFVAALGSVFFIAGAAGGGAGGGGTAPGGAPAAFNVAAGWVIMLGGLVDVGLSLLSVYGYWLLTTPDAGMSGSEQPASARRLVRIAVLAALAAVVVENGLHLAVPALVTGAPGPTPVPVMLHLADVAVSLVGMGAVALQFFAMMRYVRWLAARVPDAGMVERTRVYIWLLPVLTVVGALCMGLGPLVAMVLYFVMLWNLRTLLVECRETARLVPT